jgi:pimeloyl-ACP methyl ester carboxylesterase
MRGEFVDLAGRRLYYYAAGTRGAGEPVVFVHGFPASSHLWQGVVREMPDGHRLVVLDQLGFGRSDRPEGAALTVAAHAERLKALLDELHIENACLVGHGMGGAVVQAVALNWPDRVTRLGLVNSVAFDAWPRGAARLARQCATFAPLGRALGAPLLAGLVHGSLLPGFADAESGRHALDNYLRAFTSHLGVDALVAQLRAMRDPGVAALGERLGTLTQPTAVVWGARDPFLSVRVGSQLRDAIPGASLDVIPQARHFSPEDTPERVGAVLTALLKR